MAFVEINRNPSASELKMFGRLLPAFGVLMSALLWWRVESSAAAAAAAATVGVVTLVFFAAPALRKRIYIAWVSAVYPIGWTVSHVLTAVMYFGVITPIGLAVRLMRGDPLARRADPAATTYWCRRGERFDPATYLRQF